MASTRPGSTAPLASRRGLPPWLRMDASVTPFSALKWAGR